MPCYHPLRLESSTRAELVVSCGQCVGCRLERSRQWAVRVMHEASLYERNCSLTLTYDAEHLASMSLDYSDFQLFMKRLRRRFSSSSIRYFMCGEYGETTSRPHFHVCLFNLDFDDKVSYKSSPTGFPLFQSPVLTSLWGKGRVVIGDLTFESAAYCARYVMKKLTGDGEKDYYNIYDPGTGEIFLRKKEFCHMSLKPGIGANWLRLFWPEVLVKGTCVVRGVESSAPRFYRRRLRDLAAYEDVRDSDFRDGLTRLKDQTPARLAVSERVAVAKVSRLKRSI